MGKLTKSVLFLATACCLPPLSPAASQTDGKAPPPAVPDTAMTRLEDCKALKNKAMNVKLSAEELSKILLCVSPPPGSGRPGGFIAGRDIDQGIKFGSQRPDMLFNRPEFLRRGLVEG